MDYTYFWLGFVKVLFLFNVILGGELGRQILIAGLIAATAAVLVARTAHACRSCTPREQQP